VFGPAAGRTSGGHITAEAFGGARDIQKAARDKTPAPVGIPATGAVGNAAAVAVAADVVSGGRGCRETPHTNASPARSVSAHKHAVRELALQPRLDG